MRPTPRRAALLHIDWTRCDGRGLCTELLPKILVRDEWGYPLSRDRVREPSLPPSVHTDAMAAVKRCPRQALSLRDAPPDKDRQPPPHR
jgi:ferredoxin